MWEKDLCRKDFLSPWLVIFCNQFGKEIKRVFYLIHTFTLQFCCSSPTIKTHIISLQSVINNMYTSHLDRYEGKKKRFQCENMHSVIIVVCQGKQSFFRFVSLLKNFFHLSEEKENIVVTVNNLTREKSLEACLTVVYWLMTQQILAIYIQEIFRKQNLNEDS